MPPLGSLWAAFQYCTQSNAGRERVISAVSAPSPGAVIAGRTSWWPYLPPAVVGLSLLMFRLDDVPGLYRDEASVAIFAEQIAAGLRQGTITVRGYFNFYTAPINSYFFLPIAWLLGDSIWTLRFSHILPLIAGVFFFADLIRRFLPGRELPCLWLLVTMPSFVVNGRLAAESIAWTPLFLFGGAWSFVVLGASDVEWKQRAGLITTGTAFVLAVWNHLLLAPSVAALVAVYALANRARLPQLLRAIPWLIAGGLLGMLPRLYGIVVQGHPVLPPKMATMLPRPPLASALENLLYTAGGDGLFALTCGEVLVSLNWVFPGAVLASALVLWPSVGAPRERRLWGYTAAYFTLCFVGTWVISPGWSDLAYWANMLWLAPVLMVLALPLDRPRLCMTLTALVVLVNVVNVTVNYYYNFLQDGGRSRASVYVGGFYDTSEDFIDVRPVVDKLRALDSGPIFFEDRFNVDRFAYLMKDPRGTRVKDLLKAMPDVRVPIPEGSLIVLMRMEERPPFPQQLEMRGKPVRLRLDLSTKHHVVFEVMTHSDTVAPMP